MIRIASKTDLSTVRQIARLAYAPYVPAIGKDPAPMVADFAAHQATGELWVFDRPPVLGYIVFRVSANTGFIENVAVAPDATGQGLGTELVTFAETAASAQGAKIMELYTNIHMVANLDYYPRRGYRETCRRTENGFERVYFEKHLSAELSVKNS